MDSEISTSKRHASGLPNPTNLAMVLTFCRLVLSPVFVFVFLRGTYWSAVACLGIAIVSELTDLFDGIVARRRNEVTDFGKILDPLADSISRLTIFLCFVVEGLAPLSVVIFILYRDSMIATLRTFCAFRGVVVSARKSGKAKAVIQATVILIVLVLKVLAFEVSEPWQQQFRMISEVLIWGATAVTVLTAIDYVAGNWKVLVSPLSSSPPPGGRS